MKPDMRAMIAFTAGCAVTKTIYSYLLDQAQEQARHYDARIDHTYVTVIDKGSNAELMGTVSGKEISLIHSGDRAAIKINLNDRKFTGTITDSRGFNGEVENRIVKLYDYDEGKYFIYGLAEKSGQ